MSKKVFVSGATGTAGGAIVQALRDCGADVIVCVRPPGKADDIRTLGATVRPVDLADVSAMADAMRQADGLYLMTPVTNERNVRLSKSQIGASRREVVAGAAGIGLTARLAATALGRDQPH